MLAASAPHALASQIAGERYRLSEVGGGLGVWVDKVAAFYAVRDKADRGRVLFWYAERRQIDSNWCGAKGADGKCMARVLRSHSWIDGRTCPALASSLDRLTGLPPRRLASAGDMTESYVSEAPLISLEGWAAKQKGVGVKLTLSEFQGPVERWWRTTEASIKACWSDVPVAIDGHAERRLSDDPTTTPP